MNSKKENIYNLYKEYFEEKGRPPTLKEIGDKEGISRERARQLTDKLIRDGKFINFTHYFYKSQRVLIPVDLLQPSFIEKHYRRPLK